MTREKPQLSVAEISSVLTSFYEQAKPLEPLRTFTSSLAPARVKTPAYDFSLFVTSRKCEGMRFVTHKLAESATQEIERTAVTATVRVHFGLQSTIPIEKRSIEMPILEERCFEDFNLGKIWKTFCKIRPTARQRRAHIFKIPEDVIQHKFFFSSDHDLTKTINKRRPQYNVNISFVMKSLEFRRMDSESITEYSKLDYSGSRETERRIAEEVQFLKQLLPRNLKNMR